MVASKRRARNEWATMLHHTTDPLTDTICETTSTFENLATNLNAIYKLNSKFVDVTQFIPVTRYKKNSCISFRPEVHLNNLCTVNTSQGTCVPMTTTSRLLQLKKFFFVIPFYLQSAPVHSANCVKTYTVASRRVFSSALL
jgi:hypothetical protein